MVRLLMGGVLPKVASGGSDLLTKQHLIHEMSIAMRSWAWMQGLFVEGFSLWNSQSFWEFRYCAVQLKMHGL